MTATAPRGAVLPPGHGEGLWHLDVLWTFKVPAAATGGSRGRRRLSIGTHTRTKPG